MTSWTEARAWAYLAQRWDHPVKTEEGETRARLLGHWTVLGLCGSIVALRSRGRVTVAVAESMNTKMWVLKTRSDAYVWPQTKAGARSRAAYCRRMARTTRKT